MLLCICLLEARPGLIMRASLLLDALLRPTLRNSFRTTLRPSIRSQASSFGILSCRANLPARTVLPLRRSYSVIACQGPVKLRELGSHFFSTNSTYSGDETPSPPVLASPVVGRWLLSSSALVFAVIVVGGVTRLTESGLSITEWRPITGILPPLTAEDWAVEFGKYSTTPEFKLSVCYDSNKRKT